MMFEIFAQQNPLFSYSFLAVIALCVGSFLNVVVYRLPIMLQRAWRQEAQSILQLEVETQEKFNLSKPNSTCPQCQQAIKPWQNIPVISYIFLRGRCGHCQSRIALRYPLVEAVTALLALLLAYKMGFTWSLVAMLLFTFTCIALALIDYDTYLLPDNLVLPLLWLGLLLNTQSVFVSSPEAVIGAAVGYSFLWLVFWLFKFVTGKDGMGYGDFKLMAAFGAWFGFAVLPNIILLSSLCGAVIGILLIVTGKQSKDKPIPFGPYIIVAGWLSVVYPQYFMLGRYFPALGL